MSAERAVARTCPKCGEGIRSKSKVFCPNCGVNMFEYAESHRAASERAESDSVTYTDEQGNRLKKCPYCAEEIKAEAIVCKHCGRDLEPTAVRKVAEQRTEPKKDTNRDVLIMATVSIIAGLLMMLGGIYPGFGLLCLVVGFVALLIVIATR